MYELKLTTDIEFPTTSYIFPGQEIGRVTRHLVVDDKTVVIEFSQKTKIC